MDSSVTDDREMSGTERAILTATIELVAERGFHGSPVGEIARRAGVAAGTIYCHFSGKDDLIRRAYEEVEGECLATLRSGYPEGAPLGERYRHLCRSILRFLSGRPTIFRFLEQFHHSPYGIELRRQRFSGEGGGSIISDLFREGVESGLLRPFPIPVLYSFTFGPLIDLVRHHVTGIVTIDDGLVEEVVGSCYDAIRPKRHHSEDIP